MGGETNQRILDGAAASDQVEVIERLLPLIVEPALRDDALWHAANAGVLRATCRLWEEGTEPGRAMALTLVANKVIQYRDRGAWETLAALLPKVPKASVLSDGVRPAVSLALVMAIEREQWDMTDIFLSWADANYKQALPLRLAMEGAQEGLVNALLPRTDVQLARRAWTQALPPRWDMVNALTLLAPPAIREAWLREKKDVGNLRQALAADRAEQGLSEGLAPHQRRHRRRS